MKITFIEHSGFSVELDQVVLIFDYYKGMMPECSKNKKIFVFVSHSHGDHYNPEIWKLKEKYSEIVYILSDDIHTKEKAVFMSP